MVGAGEVHSSTLLVAGAQDLLMLIESHCPLARVFACSDGSFDGRYLTSLNGNNCMLLKH